MSTDLVVKENYGALMPIAPVSELLKAQDALIEVITKALKDGTDYGVIPYTDNNKVLLKPGAERLCQAYGLVPEFTVIEADIDHDVETTWEKKKYGKITGGSAKGRYRYRISCSIRTRDGVLVGSGVGACSTLETKYCDRPRDLENTVLKMAKKRALVDAVLTVFSLSGRFTQDVEDDEYLQNKHEERRHAESAKVIEPPPPAPDEKFYAKDPAQLKKLVAYLEGKEGITDGFMQQAICDKLDGKSKRELTSIIREVKAQKIIEAEAIT